MTAYIETVITRRKEQQQCTCKRFTSQLNVNQSRELCSVTSINNKNKSYCGSHC